MENDYIRNYRTGEEYLNARREYWRNEVAKNPDSFKPNYNRKKININWRKVGKVLTPILNVCIWLALFIWLGNALFLLVIMVFGLVCLLAILGR